MSITRRDAEATVLTALVVLAFAATHQGWNIWLIGDSRRWAAAAIFVLGALTCRLGSPGKDAATKVLGVLGVLALAFAVLALITGSLTALALLVVADVLLWLVSLLRHAADGSRIATT